MLTDQLELLLKEFTTLQEKIKNKLQAQQQTITETQTKLNESDHQLELVSKENSENEQVLAQLMKEFQELTAQLN